ncbi:MAG: hypothetical protein ACYCT2_02710 [Thermoplasmataceae archaeon]
MKIQVGKGSVTIDGILLDRIGKNYLVLKLITEAGPCTDAMCQVIITIRGTVEKSLNPDLMAFPAGGTYIAMEPAVFRSIDRGRQEVYVRENRHTGLVVKGFALVQ